ncbi:MAG: decarboxylating 6-phosphogluconate dehydrogenase [Desulfobacterales bacterium]|nr:decarboxylating 6-phosphogluconate dehydrogenase [Desulfobacterales bacterium]
MQVAIIGLGRMGMNMAKRLLRGGHEVVVYNRTKKKIDEMVKQQAVGAYLPGEVIEKLNPPRVIWIMLPAGPAVDEHIRIFSDILEPDDIVIDGGNTYYKHDIERAALLNKRHIKFMDVGVSGGIWGLEKGYCLMAGGDKDIFKYVEPLFKALAPEEGYLHCGGIGAGHFVKMIHNGIEYGMMQAYGEGFQILESSPYNDSLDYSQIAHLWNQGSVIRSWLLELAESAFANDRKLSEIQGYVADSGEGRWTVEQAIETGVSAPVIALSLMHRFRSQQKDSFSDKVVAALRREFGGHAVMISEKK